MMLQHNLLIAFRNLQRHKASFFINLIGLSTGLACAFLIYLWVHDELQFDKFHKKDSSLYQVMEMSKENGITLVHDHTQGLLAETMVKDLPEVLSAVPVMSLEKHGISIPLRVSDKVIKKSGIFAGKNFFNLFSFPLLYGKPQQVLANKDAIVISENLANSLFGSATAAIGKTIDWEMMGIKNQSLVSGVFASLPQNNSLHFDVVFTHELLLTKIWTNGQKWWNEGPATYLELKPGTDIQQFNKKIAGFIKKYHSETHFTLFVRKYSGGYLYGNYENGVQAGGRIEYVKIFSIVAIFILVIACINFMNLSTAKASARLKEVGVKKTMGSTRKMLIAQFLTEALFMTFLSVILAAVLVMLLLPVFNHITGKELHIQLNGQMTMLILSTIILTGLISGSYPAFYLSGFNPVAVLKGKLKNSVGELLARKGLVVFQFVISLVLIVSVMVIYRQMQYVQSKNLGYNKANVIYFDKDGAIINNADAFMNELKQIPGIAKASAMQESIVRSEGLGSATYGIEWPGKTDKDLTNFVVRAVDADLIETLGIQMETGRSFSKKLSAEDTKVIFNEAAIKAMRLTNPVGTRIKMWGKDLTIIGVMKDFHINSFHEAITPLIFYYGPKKTFSIVAKIEAGKEKETLSRLEAFYKKFNPGYVLEYKFLDETFQAQYVAEQRIAALSRYFAGLAILISCLGLFGLAAYNAEVRTKEIGIRKVLGASVTNVMFMLSKDFIKLACMAIIIAFPLAWWAMNSWLHSFAYRINLSAGIFIAAGISMVVITLLTVSYQAIRAATMNPVGALRSE
jgi:putative ABC transport system permease protein